jgi:hypothetical protein
MTTPAPFPAPTQPAYTAAVRDHARAVEQAQAAFVAWMRCPADPSTKVNYEAVRETVSRLARKCAIERQVES